jgi:hypothetical protein
MKRIRVNAAVLFIRHGNTPEEKQLLVAKMLSRQSDKKAVEESSFCRVDKDVPTNVPDWCENTNIWKWMKQDGSLEEYVIDTKINQVADSVESTPGEKMADSVAGFLDGSPSTGKRARRN